ncbi:MAG: XRE family transcriptional regulator [Candidatus Omnitrophota bacterium]|nr:XRE family transcriptional regulator [Candidatus Omnitrophota bacterium]
MQIGEKIQSLRKAKKMSLTELSKTSGVQLATLSRIENLKMVGTIESHINIAKSLGVSLAELYKGVGIEEKPIDLQLQETPKEIFMHSDKAVYEMLTTKVMEKNMMPILLKIEPAGITNSEQNSLGTEKFIFCLEGKIEAVINEKVFPLVKYSTLYFDASLVHYFKNAGKTQAKAVCVITPPAL